MYKYDCAIVWFRSDLRLHDNPALCRALETARRIVPLFVLDDNLLKADRLVGSARVLFMLESLHDLDQSLQGRGARLILRYGDPQREVLKVCRETGATAVFYNLDVDRAYGLTRDAALKKTLASENIEFLAQQQYAVWETKANHDDWKQNWRVWNAGALLPTPDQIPMQPEVNSHPLPLGLSGLSLLGVPDLDQTTQPGGETVALKLFQQFINDKIGRYYFAVSYPQEVDENEATSLLSPHLKFGTISGRYVIQTCAKILKHETDLSQSERKSLERFITRLRWRESMYQSLYLYPETEFAAHQTIFEGVRRPAEGALWEAYSEGRTGYPMIDAGMRCLKKTGRLAFRIRASLASFLVYGLFMEPQAGKDLFYKYLIDSNPINWWQWQLQAGTVGYSRYFMIFNPNLQARKYDPDGAFIKKWVPELSRVPLAVVGEPWRLSIVERHELIGKAYPLPIIDWRFARRQAVAALDPLRKSLMPSEPANLNHTDALPPASST